MATSFTNTSIYANDWKVEFVLPNSTNTHITTWYTVDDLGNKKEDSNMINYIKCIDPLFNKIKQEKNRISKCSIFYYYEDKIYRHYWSLLEITDESQVERLKKKFAEKSKKVKKEEIEFVKLLKNACSISKLESNGVYKLRIFEKCKISDIPKKYYNNIIDLYEKHKEISGFMNTYPDMGWMLFCVYDKNKSVGIFYDTFPDRLSFNNAYIYLVSYDVYEEYIKENNLVQFKMKQEEEKKKNNFRFIDLD